MMAESVPSRKVLPLWRGTATVPSFAGCARMTCPDWRSMYQPSRRRARTTSSPVTRGRRDVTITTDYSAPAICVCPMRTIDMCVPVRSTNVRDRQSTLPARPLSHCGGLESSKARQEASKPDSVLVGHLSRSACAGRPIFMTGYPLPRPRRAASTAVLEVAAGRIALFTLRLAAEHWSLLL